MLSVTMKFLETTIVLLLLRFSFSSVLKNSIVQITKYDTVLIVYKREVAYSERFNLVLNYLLERNRPVITVNEDSKTRHLHLNFSPVFISIVFLSDNDNLKEVLAANILHIRQSHVIVFMPKGYNMEELFKYFWTQKIINVATMEDSSELIWTYTNFPEFKISTKDDFTFKTVRDFNGSVLRIMWGDIEPRTNRYINRQGQTVIGGYAGSVIPLFAEVHNLRLVEAVPIDIGTVIYSEEMEYYIRNDTIDLGTVVKHGSEFSNQSYPLATFKWCVMLPIDYDTKVYKYYWIIFRRRMWIAISLTFLLNIFLLRFVSKKYQFNESFWSTFSIAYRSMLGAAFSLKKTISSIRFYYANMNLQGVLVTIFYVSLLSSIFIRMPMKEQVNTFEELYRSDYKVWVYRLEWERLQKITIPDKKYYKSFEILEDYQKLYRERAKFNISQGYSIASDKWSSVNILQSKMTRPKFRFTDICFLDTAMLSFPIYENSIYKNLFDEFIFDVKELGFVQYFQSRNFFEHVDSGRMGVYHSSINKFSRILSFEDLAVFFYGYFASLLVYIVIFLIEIKIKAYYP